MTRHHTVSRRRLLGRVSLAGAAAGLSPYARPLGLSADELRRQGKACIVLWMQGGPSQLETFDPKPGHANGGETKSIRTNALGLELAENLPELAKQADKLAVVRSLTSREGEHQRATYLMHTSYLPIAGVKFPALGAVVARETRNPDCELPPFVRVGPLPGFLGGGYLGPEFDPLVVNGGGRPPENTRLTTDETRFRRRIDLMERLQSASGMPEAEEHRKVYEQAAAMVLSPRMTAFDLSREDLRSREAYGRTPFGDACLTARRLVEAGVTFVEVTLGGWDTHDNNFDRCRTLCGQLDRPFAALLGDLDERGLLDSTLVVWLGEFGRTPRINPRNGRDHFPRAFSAALAGCGVRGGQVWGATDDGGDAVQDRPVTEKDFFQTVYKALGIDARKEHMTPIGRPIKFVDGGAAVEELFG